MLFFGNKYVKGITQFIPQNHFGPKDFIDYHRERMGLTREEYMAFYRMPVDYRLVEANMFTDKWEKEEAEFKRIIAAPDKRVYDLVDYVQFSTGGMTEKDWEKFMYGRYKKHLQSKDTKTKEKMYDVLKKMVMESIVNEGKFPGRKGEFIKWKGEYFDIKKTAGSTAYVKFPHTASSAFSQVWGDEVKPSDEKHKGKRVWLMESVVNEKAEGDRGPIDDEKIEKALKKKVEETGVPIEFLRIVMRRGMGAWRTGHRPGATEQQWGYARVNSFLTKQPGTWGDADADVAKEVRDGGYDKNLKKA